MLIGPTGARVERVESTERAVDATVHFLAPPASDAARLPLPLTSFVGRAEDVAALVDAVHGTRLLTVTGPGGVGKSRLALAGLDQLTERVVWVELGAVTGEGQVAPVVATALGLRQEPGRPLVETLAWQLRRQELVLALDNVEHLVAEVADLVQALLRSASGLRVLATSREPLQVPGETTWRVEPLVADDAVALFVTRAAQVQPGYRPDDGTRANIAELCRRLDGLPLAIELAAARLRVMSLPEIAASVDNRFRLLTGNARGILPQQRTLEASIAWSHDLLGPAAQRLLWQLAVFAGDFTAEASDAVGGDSEVLGQLVDRSLVQVVEVEPRRFRLLESVRDFARARLLDAGEGDEVRSRHAQHYLDLAERAAPHLTGADALLWLARLDAESHELEGALHWWAGAQDPQPFRRTIVALGLFWELRHPAAGVRWLRRAVRAEGDDSVLWAQVLWQSAHMGVYGDDLATTQKRAPEALAAAERSGDPTMMARAATTATYCTALLHPPSARAALVDKVQRCRDTGDSWGAGDALKMTSIACLTMGDDAGVLEVVQELRREAHALGNAFFLAWCDAVEGYVAVQRGDAAIARGCLSASAELCRAVGDPLTGWLTTAWLADLDCLIGERELARRGYADTLARASASGGTLSKIWALVGTARLLREDGAAADAVTALAPVADRFLVADPLWRSLFCTAYGRALVEATAGAEGGTWLRTALEAADEIGNPGLRADAHQGLGELAVAHGELVAAETAHHEALALRARVGHLPGVLASLEDLALLGFPRSVAESLRLLGATAALRGKHGLVRNPRTASACAAAAAAARADGCAVEAVMEEGAALTREEVVGYATRSRGRRGRPSHGWESLTPTELEVVRLVAQGLSNVEIGERMFIGRGTVKTHLSHVFAKLGIATRAAVAAEVSRRQVGSLPPG
ncbi:MAG: hypothetical protein QOJ79_2234 [Actinomycetota bacterium]|jgi:predicted ATPase/DNA-binding CsgD family transcriptional regulator|nr:hypothetical protein [Actinomycetota bacterium]